MLMRDLFAVANLLVFLGFRGRVNSEEQIAHGLQEYCQGCLLCLLCGLKI